LCEGSIDIERERGGREGEVDREAESEGSTTPLGRIYTPSLSDDSIETDLDADSLRTDLADSNPNSLTHGTKNPVSFGKNLNTAVENKWIIVVLLGGR